MKQYKTTIISLAVIAVVLIAFFVVSSILDKDEAEAPVPTAKEIIVVLYCFIKTSSQLLVMM